MAELSKVALRVENNTQFPNNNSGYITPSRLRGFNTDMIDSTVNQEQYNADSASWNSQINALESFSSSLDNNFVSETEFAAYTSSNNSRVNSLQTTASIQQSEIDALIQFTGSVSSVATGSLLVTASAIVNVITFTKGDASTFDVTVGADTTALNAFTASQNTKNATLASYTGSNDTKWNTLGSQSGSWVTETESGSFLVTASFASQTLTFTKGNGSTFSVVIPDNSGSITDLTSLNAFTASQDTKNATLASVTASLITETNNLELFTSSQNTKNATLALYTASVDTKFTTLASVTASLITETTNLELFTASQNTKNATLATYTGSNDTKWSTLGSQSGSWVTETESGSFLITASVSSNIITFTKGNNTQFSLTVGADTTALNAFTASQQLLNTTFATTGSNVFRGNQSLSGSIFISGSTLNVVSGSANGNVITNLGDTYTDTNPVQTIVSITSASYAALVSSSTYNPNTLYIISGAVSTSTIDLGPLNAFTASQETKDATLATYTASVNSSISQLNTFTQSQDTKNTTLQSVTASLNSATASLFTSTSLSLYSASISGQLLSFTKGNNSQFTLLIPTGSGIYVTGSYGAFQDSTTQSGSANTIHAFRFNTTDISDGVILSGSTGLQVGAYGTYNLQWSGQAVQGSGAAIVSVWVNVNGIQVSGSRGDVTLPSNTKLLPAWNYFLTLNALDVVELYWASDSGNTTWDALPIGTTPATPAAASIIATLARVDVGGGSNSVSNTIFNAYTASINAFTASQELLNTTFATTGSNTFTDNQTIQSGFRLNTNEINVSSIGADLNIAAYSGANVIVSSNTTISGSLNVTADIDVTGSILVTDKIESTGSIVLKPDVNDPRFLEIYNTAAQDTHITASGGYLYLGDDTTYVNVNNYGSDYNIFVRADNGLSISANTGITGSIDVSGSLSASLQEGYVWVGDASGRTYEVATSSFIDAGTDISALNSFTASQELLNTTFATTGSNTFYGNQIINDTAGTMGITLESDSANSWFNISGAPVRPAAGLIIPGDQIAINLLNNTNPDLNTYISNQDDIGLAISPSAGSAVDAIMNLYNYSLSVANTFTASLSEGYVWVGDATGKTYEVSTGSFGGGGSTDISALNAFTQSQEELNLTFATTGSNEFQAGQVISGSITLFDVGENEFGQIQQDGVNMSFTNLIRATAGIAIPGGQTIKLDNDANSDYNTLISNVDSVGVKFEPTVATDAIMELAGYSLNVANTFTASLTEGYVWVGDSTGRTYEVATSSFGGGGSPFPYNGTAEINGALQVTGSARGNVTQLSVTSNTASIDMTDGNYFTLNLPASANTHINASNILPGQTVTLLITSNTSATISFAPNILEPSGSFYSASASGSKDIISLVAFDNTNLYAVSTKNMI